MLKEEELFLKSQILKLLSKSRILGELEYAWEVAGRRTPKTTSHLLKKNKF
jgi:hypothetical protein